MIVVAIAGPSCSGKSTVADIVAQRLNAPILSLDVFPNKGLPHVMVDGVRTYERPERYNGAKLAAIILQVRESGAASFSQFNFATDSWEERSIRTQEYLIVEGFLIFQYPELLASCDHKFFIDLPWEEIVRRRMARKRGDMCDENFFKIGESETKLFVAPQKNAPDIVILNGLAPAQELAEQVCSNLQRVIKR